VFVVENGTDHLHGNEEATMPAELVRRGLVADDFVLVLGANYGHKNRELAIRTLAELRRRGRALTLVVVGASVPFGSRRDLEARAVLQHRREFGTADHIVTVPDVTSEERNWLLRHASVVLYPTSAEGFGLVPFEAASFGTPTVAVGFGPISEVAPDLPVVAAGWDPDDLATGVERLLDDRDLYDRQVAAVLRSGTGYTWRRTAAGLVDAYRMTLSLPSRTL
jgi:glycosyltransferase involved in cell wall biosynthesis